MNDNRRKLTGILKLLYENTDEDHCLDTYQIMDALENMGYGRPDRKTIEANIKFIINDLGFGVNKKKGKPNKYKWVKREFDLSELKMLAGAIRSSRFISSRKSRELLAKLKDLTSIHQAAALDLEMYIADDLRREDDGMIETTDIISDAIKSGKRVRFMIAGYGADKQEIMLDMNRINEVSPYAFIWNNGFYYMLGMPAEGSEVMAYRMDLLRGTEIVDRAAVPEPEDFDPERFASSAFNVCAADETVVELKCNACVMGSLIDKFGREFMSAPSGGDTFTARVNADICPEFYAWVFGFGGDVRILGPEDVRAGYEKMLRDNLASY